jgi:hypothetical protein
MRKVAPMSKRTVVASLYELSVTLLEIEPRIWRRFTVPSGIRLCCLHDVLQVVMGWTDVHAHQFEKDERSWGVIEYDHDPGMENEARMPLDKVLSEVGESIIYVYDFGDNWKHEVVLEKVLPLQLETLPLRCVAGERRCPPEDVGGVPGYQDFLDVTFEPRHEKFDHHRRWAGGPFQPEEFNLPAVNAVLLRMRLPIRHGR